MHIESLDLNARVSKTIASSIVSRELPNHSVHFGRWEQSRLAPHHCCRQCGHERVPVAAHVDRERRLRQIFCQSSDVSEKSLSLDAGTVPVRDTFTNVVSK